MPWRKTLTSGLGVMLCLLVGWGSGLAGKESALVPAETVVDYIHAVLTSDRTVYTVHVVEGLQRRGVIESSEHWLSEKALPLPAQFFQESSRLAALTGVKVQYRLISLHPINKLSGPATEFEKKGLEAIMADPDRPYKGFVREGGERRFQALYADNAVSPLCVTCHNEHLQSPKRDYKLNDVLGAVSISIPAPG
ncbi:MAG: DUF3365 domain-containing protein [Nitrospira sp.]|nr:DUF3365 domain-containing protein [Nitrospira sp.]MDH4369728.1 DUF3365 domain-containing protein [Nitrospira sp.]MDH5347830.1 DUF3365 domain-containing protein [Nitrospira sp.]MDH5498480.1 DUF3365 domain-containing protein [Nitrospira sp.]